MGGTAQKPLYSTGSFTGFHSESISKLGAGYLSAESHTKQPLCANAEGWGPLSNYRYDFTPCFMDVWVGTVAAFGILGGAVAIWWLVRRKQRFVVERNWHFWGKQVRHSSFRR
jgi:ATP-binding cassette subfamily C (CFTR/MRP) protein 1